MPTQIASYATSAHRIIDDNFAAFSLPSPVVEVLVVWPGGTTGSQIQVTVTINVHPDTLSRGQRALIEWGVVRALMGYTNLPQIKYEG